MMDFLLRLLNQRWVLLGLCSLCLVIILWGMQREKQAAESLDRLNRQLQFFQVGPVAPNAAALESLEAANAQLRDHHSTMDAQLFRGEKEVNFSGDSTAAYFELAGFVEELNQKLTAAGVTFPEGERYGFSEFEQQGPSPGILGAVMTQKRAAEVIMDALIDARPDTHGFLKREMIVPEPEENSLLQGAAGGQASQRTQFSDTAVSASKLEGFESYTFELQFEGYSESLRQLLKGLTQGALPVLVKELRVLPLERYEEVVREDSTRSNNPFDAVATSAKEESDDGPVPIIRNNLSSFHLVLEVLLGEEARVEY